MALKRFHAFLMIQFNGRIINERLIAIIIEVLVAVPSKKKIYGNCYVMCEGGYEKIKNSSRHGNNDAGNNDCIETLKK